MNKLYEGLKAAVLVALTVLLVVASIVLWHVKKVVDFEQPRVTALVSELTLTTKIARKTSADESAFLKTQQPQITAALNNFNKVLQSAQGTLDTTTSTMTATRSLVQQTEHTVAGIEPMEQAATNTLNAVQPPLAEMTKTFATINTTVGDPEIHATLVSVHGTADEVHGVASDAHRVTKHYVDKWLAVKSKLRKVGDDIGTVGSIVAKWFPPLF